MRNRNSVRLAMLAGAVAIAGLSSIGTASLIVKDNNTTNLDQPGSWVGGVVPGSGDIAMWDSTVGSNSVSLGSDQSWLGMTIDASHTGNIAIGSGNDLTLGAAGLNFSPNITTTLNNTITLNADQTWDVAAGTLSLGTTATVNTQGYQLTLVNGGTQEFKAAITGGGSILISSLINNRTVKFTSGATASDSDITVTGNGGATTVLTFNGTNTVPARAKSLTLIGAGASGGANLLVDQSATTSNTVDSITNNLTIGQGFALIAIRARSTQNAQLAVGGSFIRQAGGVVYFNGNGLGTSAVGTGANSANITFTTTPTLTGGGGTAGQSTIGIIKGAYGDTTYSTTINNSGTAGLVTYDGSTGVRLLSGSEYTSSITDGQMQLDNVLLANSSGTGIATTTLNSNTTVNSLSFNVSGTNTTAGSGIAVTGAGTLKLNSGMIYASQTINTGNSNNSMVISVPTLDLNGQEGIVIAGESALTSTRSGGRLEISSVITNDGGKGLTFAGGVLALTGSSNNTYTGVTTIDGGSLVLLGSAAAAIPGNIVINGGAVEDGSNHIADTSNITINGGAFRLQIGNEGSARSETYNNLTMNGGSYGTGASNHTGASNINGTATLAGGAVSISSQTSINVAGLTTMSGGTITVSPSSSTNLTTYNTALTLNGDLAISNLASDPYTPLSIKAGNSTTSGGKMVLDGNLTFTGNATNPNTVTIDAPTGAGTQGILALNGTRIFNVGDGAAATDLAVVPDIVDGSSAGGITKTGAGSLALSGNNVYTGGTTVSAGTLIAGNTTSGQSSTGTGPVTLNGGTLASLAGATSYISGTITAGTAAHSIAPGGIGAIGQLNVGGLSLDGNSTLNFDITDLSSDLLADSGLLTITGTPTISLTSSDLSASSYILATYSASGLSDSSFNFSSTPSGYHWNVTDGQLQLLQDTTVPEPASLALLGLAAAAGLIRRRRRTAE